jgi:hypothetical protein
MKPEQPVIIEQDLEYLKFNLQGWKDHLDYLFRKMASLHEPRLLLEEDAPHDPDLAKFLITIQVKDEDDALDQINSTKETIADLERQIAKLEGRDEAYDLTPEELKELEEDGEEEKDK